RHDRIRALRAGARYDFLDTILGVAVNAIDVEVSQGLGILGASEEGRANLTRAEGDPQFTKIEAEIQRLQRIDEDFNLLLIGRGQWSADPLLSSEEFSVGGIGLGRGYDPSEITGDDGIAAKAELQWNSPYATDLDYIDGYQVYSFFDVGTVWDQDPTTNDQKRDSISSTGAGVRVNFTGQTQADLAVAFPLTRDVQTQGDRDPKVYFGLNKRF
ncbi:MAG: ShlB/FhaC/HecB family hemolysin secretion/activation protein, partial [Pseudomonadota bacterium]